MDKISVKDFAPIVGIDHSNLRKALKKDNVPLTRMVSAHGRELDVTDRDVAFA